MKRPAGWESAPSAINNNIAASITVSESQGKRLKGQVPVGAAEQAEAADSPTRLNPSLPGHQTTRERSNHGMFHSRTAEVPRW